MNKEQREAIQAIRENNFYDWISNNGHLLSKEELTRIIKEFAYAVHQSKEKDEIQDNIAEELTDMWSY